MKKFDTKPGDNLLAVATKRWSADITMQVLSEQTFLPWGRALEPRRFEKLADEVAGFREFGQPTRRITTRFADERGVFREVPTFVNEFWTARQRQASSLHEVSYRACFK